MDHDELRDLLTEYHDGELSPEKRGEVERHLQSCRECGGELGRLRRLARLFKRPAPASEEFVRGVLARLPAETGEPSPALWRPWLAPALAMAAAALLLALDLGSRNAPGVHEENAEWGFQGEAPAPEELLALALEAP